MSVPIEAQKAPLTVFFGVYAKDGVVLLRNNHLQSQGFGLFTLQLLQLGHRLWNPKTSVSPQLLIQPLNIGY